MRFTKRTYKQAYRRLIDAGVAAWMDWSKQDDDEAYLAYRIIMGKANRIVERAHREKGMWY